jgi:hypothetical protein
MLGTPKRSPGLGAGAVLTHPDAATLLFLAAIVLGGDQAGLHAVHRWEVL